MIITQRVKSLNESNSILVPPNFHKVNCFTWHEKDSPYYQFSPYFLKTDGHEELKNDGGILFENFWQGSKVYPIVYPNDVYPHHTLRGNPKLLQWSWKSKERHLSPEGQVNENYFKWRQSIYACPYPIRYPNQYQYRKTCAFVLFGNSVDSERLDYIQARKRIYVQEYSRLVRQLPLYQTLLQKLQNGENISIVEIDLPCKEKTGIWHSEDNFKPTLENLNVLIEDRNNAFGHGLVLSKCLLEDL